jgi:rod shape-determining protein MreC
MLRFFIKRKRFFFFSLLVILCVALITLGVDKNQKQLPAEKALQSFFSYPLSLTALCINTTTDLWNSYVHLIDVEKRNSELQKSIHELILENQQLREHFLENQRLKTLLDFKQQFSYHMLPAEIIGKDPTSWFKTILVNKGTEAGVERGGGVISPQGVVGTVIETTLHSSKILLITDQNSTIDIMVKRSRVRGILEGLSENACRVNYIVKKEDIKKDDEIISSGLNAVFPRGILVGSVIETDNNPDGFFKNIEVMPAVDFSKLNEVLIVLKNQDTVAETEE